MDRQLTLPRNQLQQLRLRSRHPQPRSEHFLSASKSAIATAEITVPDLPSLAWRAQELLDGAAVAFGGAAGAGVALERGLFARLHLLEVFGGGGEVFGVGGNDFGADAPIEEVDDFDCAGDQVLFDCVNLADFNFV